MLANIYMRRFVKGWKTGGHEKRLNAQIVNYADDFVICCRGTADEAMTVMRDDDVEAEADGERAEDAAVPPAGRDVRLSGLHPRSQRRLPQRASPTWDHDRHRRRSTGYAEAISE